MIDNIDVRCNIFDNSCNLISATHINQGNFLTEVRVLNSLLQTRVLKRVERAVADNTPRVTWIFRGSIKKAIEYENGLPER